MSGAPTPVEQPQLDELGIAVTAPENSAARSATGVDYSARRECPTPFARPRIHVEPTLREREPVSGLRRLASRARAAPTWLARFTRTRPGRRGGALFSSRKPGRLAGRHFLAGGARCAALVRAGRARHRVESRRPSCGRIVALFLASVTHVDGVLPFSSPGGWGLGMDRAARGREPAALRWPGWGAPATPGAATAGPRSALGRRAAIVRADAPGLERDLGPRCSRPRPSGETLAADALANAIGPASARRPTRGVSRSR